MVVVVMRHPTRALGFDQLQRRRKPSSKQKQSQINGKLC